MVNYKAHQLRMHEQHIYVKNTSTTACNVAAHRTTLQQRAMLQHCNTSHYPAAACNVAAHRTTLHAIHLRGSPRSAPRYGQITEIYFDMP